MNNHIFYENWKMTKEGYLSVISYLNNNSIFYKENDKNLFIDFNKKRLEKKEIIIKEYIFSFNIKWIDSKSCKNMNKMIKSLNLLSQFLFQSGGWDATNYYLIGTKNDPLIKKELENVSLRKAYEFLKNSDNKKIQKKKEQLILIEELLSKLNMNNNEIKEWILSPNDFLFDRTPLETVLTNEADILIDFLQKRVGA